MSSTRPDSTFSGGGRPIASCPRCNGVFPAGVMEVTREGAVLCRRCALDYQRGKASQLPQPIKQQQIADRVGADVFVCDCGNTVPISLSVRMMIKDGGRGGRTERVCYDCSIVNDAGRACRRLAHQTVMTPKSEAWDSGAYPFSPLPDDLTPGVCLDCGETLYWNKDRWTTMTWQVLAEAWERSS